MAKSRSNNVSRDHRENNEAVTATSSHQVEDSFPFMKLPSEVRNQIYRYVLTASWSCEMIHVSTCCKYVSASSLALLEVSRQIYQEAFHLFYQENTLVFENTDDLARCLHTIGYARRQEIRKIEFFWVGQEPKAAFRLLRTCQKLKEVTIENYTDGLERSGLAALREVRGLEVVRTAYGTSWHRYEQQKPHWQSWAAPPATNDGSLAYYMMRPRLIKEVAHLTGYDLYNQPISKRRRTEVQRLAINMIRLSK
ncbi:hypothetical protein MMC18_005343 [Xylographa bjoerkii]|nr:hypothetical protein [Xylographa bjoerkii]